jgi:phospholipase/lecithinase/hemolysin
MRTLNLVVTTFALALVTEKASAGPFTRLWVFGDSNVDTGWYKIAPWSGSNTFDIYLQQSSTYGIGKPTTNPGPISVQVLARILGHTRVQRTKGERITQAEEHATTTPIIPGPVFSPTPYRRKHKSIIT